MVLQDKFKYPEDIVIRAIEYPVLELLYESRIHKFVHRLMITAHMHVLHNCAPIWRIGSVSSEFFVGIVEEYCPQRCPEFRRDFAALHLAWKGAIPSAYSNVRASPISVTPRPFLTDRRPPSLRVSI